MKREVDNSDLRFWTLRRSAPLLLACAVYALFGSIVWSAYHGTERRPPFEGRLAERAADPHQPGDIEDGALAARSVFPADEVLRRAIRPFHDPLQIFLEPATPPSPGAEGERATLLGTARSLDGIVRPPPSEFPPEQADPVEPQALTRTIAETPNARPGPATETETTAAAPSTPASEAARVPEPEPASSSPPRPSFKPLQVVAALASAESSAPEGLGAQAAPSAATSAPPKPAFKPFFEQTDLAGRAGGSPRVSDSSDRRKSRTFLGSFWSGVKALFDSPPRRVLLAAGDGGDRQAGRGDPGAGDRSSPGDDGGTGGRDTSGGDRDDDDGDDGGRGGVATTTETTAAEAETETTIGVTATATMAVEAETETTTGVTATATMAVEAVIAAATETGIAVATEAMAVEAGIAAATEAGIGAVTEATVAGAVTEATVAEAERAEVAVAGTEATWS